MTYRWVEELMGGRERQLPARVQEAIRAQQDKSEILIGWIQLAILVAFGTLYFLGRKAFPPEVTFRPVPWALSAYSAFTLLRLVWAHRARLPEGFVALSVVVDMGLLFGLIFSFHIQYMQPASFYLKAPTFAYVFIFIALRALRFEAKFIWLAGLSAAAMWLAMVGYVVWAVPDDPMITKNYVTYLTSNSILLGAEFDKIASILVVTIVLALAVERARRFLEKAVTETSAAQELSRFFAPEIAKTIARAEDQIAPGTGLMREAAVMAIDIRGFTLLSAKLTANQLVGLLTEFHSRVVPAISTHGGTVDKFLGDGILVTFGAARGSDRPEAEALEAAEGVLAAVAEWNRARPAEGQIRLGIGIASGSLVFGAVGDESRLEYTVIGEPANLAAKLEKHCKAETAVLVVPQGCFAKARAKGYAPKLSFVERPQAKVAGVDRPMDLALIPDAAPV